MKICGVIAEYNPFHNGHAYQLAEARRLSGCDWLVAVMGGAFSQRGETMLLDKWTRACMALQNGADLVIELPCLFAVRSADAFARGGICILSALGADAVSFGCETDDLPLLNRILDAADQEEEALSAAIRLRLEQGQSHARARGEALAERLDIPSALLNQPNTVLALEYLRANRALTSPMEVHPVRRGEGYHDLSLHAMASASAIRAQVRERNVGALRGVMPESAFEQLQASMPGRLADMSRLDALLMDRLRTMTPEALRALPEVNEGLEHRVIRCAQQAGSRETLLTLLKCKRYTHARLSRLCAHAMLGMTARLAAAYRTPPYARVLGLRREAMPLLARLDRTARLPLVTLASALREEEVFSLERRATDLQSLCFEEEHARAAGRDLTERLIVL